MLRNYLHILSLNVNGLRDSTRRRCIFLWLKQLTYDVILLQDIRFTEQDDLGWSQEWGLPVLWSEHNAILLTNKSFSISRVDSDSPRWRCLIGKVCCGVGQGDVMVGSVYIPAGRSERRQYSLNLPDQLCEDLCMLGGDFNVAADPAVDLFPPRNERASVDWRVLSEKLQQWDVCDLHTRYN